MASIFRCLVVLLVVATCSAGDSLPVLFNAGGEVVFGQSAAFSGPAGALGNQMRLGIQAAFAEANGRRGPGVPSLGLIAYDDVYEPGPSANNTKKLIQEHGVFALIGEVGTPTSQVAVPIATASKVPFVGAFTGAKFLRSPYKRYVVNYRASYIDETASMVNMFVNGMYLSRISIVYQADSFGAAGYEGVDLALRVRRMVIHSEGTYERNTVNITGAIEALRARADPEAIIMIGAYAPLAAFVKEAKKLWPKAFFATVSFVGSYAFAAGLETAEMRKNVFITQVVDFPEDPSVPLVADYQAALRSLYPSATPDFTSLEGYIAGRMCAEVVARIASRGNVTREAFLDEIYGSMMMVVGGLRLGPFGGDCSQTKSGCQCNQGQRQVYGTRVLGDGGFARHAPLDFTFATCGFQASDSNTIIFGQSVDLSGPSASFGKSLQAGLLAAFQQANQKRLLGSFVVKLSSLDDASDPATALANARTLLIQGGAFALIGSAGTETSVGMLPALSESNAPLIGPASGAGSLRWPFNRGVLNIRASSVDETAAIVAFFVTRFGFKKFAVFAESGERGASGGAGVDLALRSYGLTVYSNATYNRSSFDVEAGLDVLRLGGAPDVVVMIGSVEPLAKFVKLAKGVWPTCHFGATSFVDGEAMSSLLETPGMRANVLITSVVPLPTDASLALVRSYQDAMRRFNSSLPLSSVSFEAYLAATLAFQVLKMLPVIARQAFVDKIYETQRVPVADGMTLGPFMEPSRSGREGCNVGMRAVFLFQMKPSGVLEYAEGLPAFEFPDHCGMRNPQCTAGYYRSSPDEVCQFCGPGNFAHDGECSACPLGSLGGKISSLACELCPAGSYTDAVGQTSCKPCLPGTFGTDQGASACTLCPAGSQQTNPGSFACEPCGSGTFASEEGTGTCTRCPVGTFASSIGLTHCAMCMKPLTTEYPGAITEAECVCPAGFFMDVGSTTCSGCKKGMVCEIASDMRYFSQSVGTGPVPKLETGYWSSAAEPLNVFQCRSAFSCPGGLPGTCGAQLEGRACAHCLEGFYWDEGRCTECGQSVSTPALFPLVPILIGFTLPVIQYKISSKPYEKWGTKAATAGVLVFVLLNHYQIIAIIGSAEVDVPMSMEYSYKLWSFTNEMDSVFKTKCNSMANLRDIMLVKALIPLIIGVMALIDYLVAIMVARVTKKTYFRMEPDRLFNGFGSLMFTFFGAIAAMSVDLWKCTSNPNGQRTMFSDASVICFESDDWNGMLVISVLAVMLYVIFGGLVMVWAIVKAKSKFADKGFRTRWKFLFEKYRLGAWWFGLAFLAKNFLVNLAFVVFPIPSFQFYFVAFVIGTYMVLILLVWPYRAHWPNRVEMACCACVCLSCMFVVSFTFLQEADASDTQAVSNLAAVVAWSPLGMGGLVTIYLRGFSLFKKFNLCGVRSRHLASKDALQKEAVKVQEMFGIMSSVSKEELLTLYEQTGEYEHWLMRHVYLVLGGELTGAQDASSPAKKTQISTMKTLTLSGERQSSSRGSSKGPVFVVI